MNKQKQKGNRFERELVETLKKHGFDAERARGSDGRAMGEQADVDIRVNDMSVLGTLLIQAKRRKRVADYLLPPPACNAVVIREDYGRPYVVFDLEWLLEKLK